MTAIVKRHELEPFDFLFRNLFDDSEFFSPVFGLTQHQHQQMPYPVDIYETDLSIRIDIAAIGLDKEDIEISECDNVLTVSYNKKEPELDKQLFKHMHRGITRKAFNLSWKFSDKFNPKKVEAALDKGLLTLIIPKKEEQTILKNKISIK